MKNTIYLFLLSWVILTITCCAPKEENNLSTHKIIFLTDYYEEYVKNAKDHDKKYQDSCLRKRREYIFIRYFSKCENTAWFNDIQVDTMIVNASINELSKTLTLINNNRGIIEERIKKALVNCYKYLPYDSVSIFVGPSSLKKEASLNMHGISGFTPGSKIVLLFIDPSIKDWEDALEVSVAHEFHHTYWIKHNNSSYNNTLLEWLVCEGKAEAFSHLVYPDYKETWDTSMTIKQRKEIWDTIKNKLSSTDHEYNYNIMFGGKGYPFACGYKLGHDLMSSYLKKTPNMEVKHWTNFSAEHILKESGYK